MVSEQEQFTIDDKALQRWYALPVDQRNAMNNQAIDDIILPWKVMLRRAKKQPLPGLAGFHVVFFHVPKTGGTTLDYITAKNYRIDYVYQVNAPAFDQHVAGVYKNHKMFRVLMGHYELNDYFYQLFDRKKMVHFTMLREPVGRVISYYDYLRSSPNHPKHHIAKDLSLKEFVVHPDIDEMPNGQSNRIMGLLKKDLWQNQDKSDEQMIEDVKYQLTHRFSLFGLTEFYDHFLLMAQRALGWKDIFYQRMNSSKVKTDKSTIDPEVMALIREQNKIDVALYDYAKKLFIERFAEMGLTEHMIESYKKLNKQYDALLNQQVDNSLS